MRNIAKLPREIALPLCDRTAVALLAHVEHAVWMYDLEKHRVRWANGSALRFWKAETLEDLMARDFQPASEGTAERLANMRHELAAGGTLAENWTLYPSGEPRHVACRFTGVRFSDGAIGMMVEAQGEKGDLQAAGGAELRAIEALRQTPLMISLLTTAGHWLLHNPAAEALMFALDLHNIPNMDNFLQLFAEDEAAAVARLRTQAIEDGNAQAVLRMTGRTFRMHDVRLRRVQDPVTGKLSLMLTQQDVTRAYKLERRLERALARERTVAETQRQFLSLTSHEFRTPLSIIDSMARRIEKLLPEKAGPIVERLGTIRAAVKRMNTAVDNTLSAARIAEGKFSFHPVLTDIGKILGHAIRTQQTLHPHRLIESDLPHLSQIAVDPALIEQVFENLLSNAIKYSPPESVIEIKARLEALKVIITITDHGIGVPAEEIGMLFTRFFRSSNTRGIKGTGIGLHTVRYFMELHDGTVALESEEGKGSTVTLSFPLPGA